MKNKTHKQRRRYRSPKSTLATNCRVVLSANCDDTIAGAFKRHVPGANITLK